MDLSRREEGSQRRPNVEGLNGPRDVVGFRWRLGEINITIVAALSANNDVAVYKLCFHITHNYIAITRRYNKSPLKSAKVITNYEGCPGFCIMPGRPRSFRN